MENWKDIPGYEGRYQVSDLGRVRSASGAILAQQYQNTGYRIVHLYANGKRSVRTVHRLVAAAFVKGFFPGAIVNHLDGTRDTNTAGNLEWVTHSGNMTHASRTGVLKPRRFAVVGTPVDGGPEVHFASQIAAEIALAGRGSSAVHHCLVGRKKSAYGYTWARA